MAEKYETVIGLEVHVELATKTKIFCGCSTAFGDSPNSHTCPICLGMPGTLPMLNGRVLEYAVAAGIAMNCDISRFCRFDRKNYFYPDNPQNYQISQLYLPICRDGWVEIEINEDPAQGVEKLSKAMKNPSLRTKKVGIHEIHMEEDAGKLVHDDGGDYTLIDYNRAGVPLIEIVSEPDMRTAQEVIAYLEKLRRILQYLGVSDCKLQEGSMRVDVNLSLRKEGTKELGIRTEMKNLGSFHAISRAIESERQRQQALLESGREVVQETRRWDEGKETSYAMRSKENARDYRYFPDPDLAPICISHGFWEKIRAAQPEFCWEKRKRYKAEYDIPEYDIDIITDSRQMAELFEATVALGSQPKKVSNWLMGETLRLLRERNLDPSDIRFTPENLAKLIALTESRTINSTVAKEVFEIMFTENADPEKYVKEQGLAMVADEETLRRTAEKVIRENPKSVQDYIRGKDRALGYLVGQTMIACGGKADPVGASRLLKELLQQEVDEA